MAFIHYTHELITELINIFEIFLPQLLRYPNPADPLNGEAAALLLRDPKAYAKKVETYVERYATPEDAAQAGDGDDDDDDEGEMTLGGPSSYRSVRAAGVLASTPIHAAPIANGHATNGHATNGSNGTKPTNGTSNGVKANGNGDTAADGDGDGSDDDDKMSDMGELSDGDEFMGGEMDD